MATLKKAVLKVGETMQSPDGPVPITAERLTNFAAQHKRLTAAKYDVPSRWEHADATADMLPLATEEFKAKLDGRHAVGKMVGFDYTPGADQAELTLEVSDARAAEQCEANRVKVSPIIAGWWKDGHGNEYTDFISHADLVERPVDHTQGPFVKVPETIACSLEKWIDAKTVRLAFGEDDESKKKKSDDPSGSEAPPDVKPELVNPDAPKPATDNSKLEALIQHAAQIGIVVPSDTTAETLVDNFLTAFQTYNAVTQKQKEDEADKKEDEPATVASPGYAQMSTETKAAVELKAAVEYANTIHRDRIKERLERLSAEGQCTPEEARERSAELTTIRLSLDAENKPISSDLEKWIKSREAVPKGTFWSAEQRTKLSAEPATPPYRGHNEQSDDEVAADVDAQLKRSGYSRHVPAKK
jgi:hypothetical protein